MLLLVALHMINHSNDINHGEQLSIHLNPLFTYIHIVSTPPS